MRAAAWITLAGLWCTLAHAQSAPGSFSFGLIADMPYFRFERLAAARIMVEMSNEELAFVIHAGDIKSGFDVCDDATMLWNRKLFDGSRHPLVYVPGDNDWTDCHRESNGRYDPLERLQRLREIFHAGSQSLGQRTIRLARQSDHPRFSPYRENVRWQHGAVLFVGLNVSGSNNNFGRSAISDGEYRRRNAANIAWLTQSFELANRRLMRAVVVVIHANPLFELPETEIARRGYNEFLRHLRAETIAFGKPVVLVHGDSHNQRVDHPLFDRKTGRALRSFTRVETFGSPFLGWVKVSVDPEKPELFTFEAKSYATAPRAVAD